MNMVNKSYLFPDTKHYSNDGMINSLIIFLTIKEIIQRPE